MKKILLLHSLSFLLVGCSYPYFGSTYDFKDITGHPFSEVEMASYNCSKYQSAEFLFNLNYLKYIDVIYKKTDMHFSDLIHDEEKDYSIAIYLTYKDSQDHHLFYVYKGYIYVENMDYETFHDSYVSTKKVSFLLYLGEQ